MFHLETVVWEHPIYGEARVSYRWREVHKDVFEWKPVAVEFDLFTPPIEQAVLMESLMTDDEFRRKVRETISLHTIRNECRKDPFD